MGEKRDLTRSVLLGLAIGDAMGYPLEGRTLTEIRKNYGPNGLMGYDLVDGYADITSYTQVAAFTLNGLLLALAKRQKATQYVSLHRYVSMATREWSRSQRYSLPEQNYCWLSAVPAAKRRRSQDSRMIDALERENLGTMERPVVRSDHPGALTQAVAVALLHDQLDMFEEDIIRLSAELVAQTHGEPEAFLSAAVLTKALIYMMEYPQATVDEILQEAQNTVQQLYGETYPQISRIWALLEQAQRLAKDENICPTDAMEQLGCHSSAEVLAGALYACLASHGDFDTAVITAVNHSGRSAAVGAVTGAVLGLRQGPEALPEFYLESLEAAMVLVELADDVAQGVPDGGALFNADWDRKYSGNGI